MYLNPRQVGWTLKEWWRLLKNYYLKGLCRNPATSCAISKLATTVKERIYPRERINEWKITPKRISGCCEILLILRSSRRSSKTSKSIAYLRIKTKRLQEKRQASERILERLSQEYQAYEAEISDRMIEMSEDENKSSRSSYTLVLPTQTESEEERPKINLLDIFQKSLCLPLCLPP